MRHPFQRRTNAKNTVQTPFQREMVRHLGPHSGEGGKVSGRELSAILGRSSNHISLMLNDGFVPSGPTIVEMAEVLRLSEVDRDRLLFAAVETKATQRSRDAFWLEYALRRVRSAEAEVARLRDLLSRHGLGDGGAEAKLPPDTASATAEARSRSATATSRLSIPSGEREATVSRAVTAHSRSNSAKPVEKVPAKRSVR